MIFHIIPPEINLLYTDGSDFGKKYDLANLVKISLVQSLQTSVKNQEVGLNAEN